MSLGLVGSEMCIRDSANAKRVIPGAMALPVDELNGRSEAPQVAAIGASAGVDLESNNYYSIISPVAFYFALSNDPNSAVTVTSADTYWPANQQLIVYTGDSWRRIDMLGVAAGSAQVQRLLM